MKELKELKSYIHLYIGCRVQWARSDGNIVKQELTLSDASWLRERADAKLILRPLESISAAEVTEYFEWPPRYVITKFSIGKYGITISYKYPDWITEGQWMHSGSFFGFNDIRRADKFIWLLSKGFDLFGLEDAGLAIYENDIAHG